MISWLRHTRRGVGRKMHCLLYVQTITRSGNKPAGVTCYRSGRIRTGNKPAGAIEQLKQKRKRQET